MQHLTRITQLLDGLNERVGRAVSWFTVLMVLVTFAVAILRYLFNLGWIAMQESITYLHAMVFMLGASYTLRHDGHVRVDVIYGRLSPRGKAVVDVAGSLFLLLPVCLFILFSSWGYVAESWRLLEGSPEAGGLHAVFLLKSAIPVMAVLLVLQGISLALRSVLVLLDRPEAAPLHDAPQEI